MELHASRRRIASTYTLLAVVLAVAGCGSSSHPGSTAASAAERPAAASGLIASADAICKRVDTLLLAASGGARDLSVIARSAPRNAALERAALTELESLKPPASIARDWARIIAYRRTLADELVRLGRDAKANDRRAIQAIAVSKKRAHDKLFAIATRDGFKDCAQVTATKHPIGVAPPAAGTAQHG